jgi:hypothetical protein
MIDLSENIGEITDPQILEVYLQQIQNAEKEADENYKIACEIENVIER